jgi:hypothetical protein
MLRLTPLMPLVVLALLAGCAATRPQPPASPAAAECGPAATDDAPTLRLSPASLGRSLAVQQQLAATVQGRTQRIDVLLEADAQAVRLALVSMGQTAARLTWDGVRLDEQRASWLPAVVAGERILSDLQLAMWPEDVVRAALPSGWFLDTPAGGRVLRQAAAPVVTVSYPSAQRIEIHHLRDGYHLVVDTRDGP